MGGSESRPPQKRSPTEPTVTTGRSNDTVTNQFLLRSLPVSFESLLTQQDYSQNTGDNLDETEVLCCTDRRSVARTLSASSQAKENPYDFRHLLRKTSQRRKLIKKY